MNFLKMFLRGIGVLPSLIQGVESIFGAKTGAQKRQAALEIVGSAVNLTEALANKTIVDGETFTAGLGQVIDGIVACLNASVWSKSATAAK